MENNDQSPEYNESNNENLVEDLKKAVKTKTKRIPCGNRRWDFLGRGNIRTGT